MEDLVSRDLIQHLTDWATQERFVYHHHWRTGDLVFWDNRQAMHKLQPFDTKTNRRLMWRITLTGKERVV